MDRKGFTLIELVMILVLAAILAAVVIPRLGDMTTTKAAAFMDKLRVDIRYAQNLAMTRNLRSRVIFNGTGGAPASGYAVVSGTTSTCSAFIDPVVGGPVRVTLGAGDYANISIVPGMNCLEYDALGQPYNCTTAPAPASCSTTLSGMAITVKANAATVGTVTITTQTGAVN
jgi:prepilin-type N-terminal cleavage/methylation domain-containing protein